VEIIRYHVVLTSPNCEECLVLKCLKLQKCCFSSIYCLLFLSVNSPFLDTCNEKSYDPFPSFISTRIRSRVTQGRFDSWAICRAAEHAISIVHTLPPPVSPSRHPAQQERLCTNFVTLWCFRVTVVAMERQQCPLCVLLSCTVAYSTVGSIKILGNAQ
jgi:hypothetical protein